MSAAARGPAIWATIPHSSEGRGRAGWVPLVPPSQPLQAPALPQPPIQGAAPHRSPGAVRQCAPSSTARPRSWSAAGHWGTWGGRRVVGGGTRGPPCLCCEPREEVVRDGSRGPGIYNPLLERCPAFPPHSIQALAGPACAVKMSHWVGVPRRDPAGLRGWGGGTQPRTESPQHCVWQDEPRQELPV